MSISPENPDPNCPDCKGQGRHRFPGSPNPLDMIPCERCKAAEKLTVKPEKYCHDYGDNPACLGPADPKYTMDFSEIEPGTELYWCSHCGPAAHRVMTILQKYLEENGPKGAIQVEALVTAAESTQKPKN